LSQPPSAHIIGSPFIELQSVDSTNNYARELIRATSLPDRQASPTGRRGLAQHGMAIFAHEQVAGKGQRGRNWNSEKGKNIALSLLIDPFPLTPEQQFQLSACTAVAVHAFFSKYAADKTTIKWPNDLYWQDRKAGGILIESGLSAEASAKAKVGSRESAVDSSQSTVRSPQSTVDSSQSTVDSLQSSGHERQHDSARWEWAIIGIGININQVVFPESLPNPVSLKQITGRDHDPLVLAKELCAEFHHYFTELTTKGFDTIFNHYNKYLYKRNEKVRLKKENRIFEVLIKGVTPSGKLITQHAIGEEFSFAEVEWII